MPGLAAAAVDEPPNNDEASTESADGGSSGSGSYDAKLWLVAVAVAVVVVAVDGAAALAGAVTVAAGGVVAPAAGLPHTLRTLPTFNDGVESTCSAGEGVGATGGVNSAAASAGSALCGVAAPNKSSMPLQWPKPCTKVRRIHQVLAAPKLV